jgi:hypothetical protein
MFFYFQFKCIFNNGVVGQQGTKDSVDVTVAVEPNVEIKDAFGTVVIVQG